MSGARLKPLVLRGPFAALWRFGQSTDDFWIAETAGLLGCPIRVFGLSARASNFPQYRPLTPSNDTAIIRKYLREGDALVCLPILRLPSESLATRRGA